MHSDEKLLGGRYRLGSQLGRGGMGEVRLGLDVKLGRAVAIKLLAPDLAGDPAARERFQREARSAARLNHPSIVAVFDTGEVADLATEVATPYIVMELVEGQTLGTLLRRGEPLPPKRALQLISGVLDALAHSHDAGIVHQDIKPGNVMLDQSGDVKVMDFGIARIISDAPDGAAPASMVFGSARYLSPEQARGEATDMRSDIYSCGCLLYELLAGRPPFVGDDPMSITVQHLHEPPVPPSQRSPAVRPDVDAVVLRALAKSPEDRYQSAPAMRAEVALVRERIAEVPALVSTASATQMRAFVSRVAGPPLRRVGARQLPRRAVPPASSRHRRRAALATAAVIAVALPLGGFGLYSVNQPDVVVAGGAPVSQVLEAPKAQADVLPGTAEARSGTRQHAVSSGTRAPAAETRTADHRRLSQIVARAARPVSVSQTGAAGHRKANPGSEVAAGPTVHPLQTQALATVKPVSQPTPPARAATSALPRQRSAKKPAAAAPRRVPVHASASSTPAPAPTRAPRVAKRPTAASPTPSPSRSPRPTSKPAPRSKPSSPSTSRPAVPKHPRPATKRRSALHQSPGQGSKRGHAARANRHRAHPRADPPGSTAPGIPQHHKTGKSAKKAKPSQRLKHDRVHKPAQHLKKAKQVKAAHGAAKAIRPATRHGQHRPQAAKPSKHRGGKPSTTPRNGGGPGKGRHKHK